MSDMDSLRAGLSDRVRPLFEAARAMVQRIDPDVVEVAWPNGKTAGFGVGPKKMSEQYVYFDVYERHLNLGFYYGAELPDPHGLLRGSGKMMRSMRIAELADLDREGMTELIRVATTHLPRLQR